jgi:hypothetical protein
LIAFKDIQKDARDTIAAKPYFAGEQVIEDKGNQKTEIETALRTRGFVVIVCPVLKGKVHSQADGVCVINAGLFIQIELNPAVNGSGTGAQKDLYLGLHEAVAALIEKAAINPNDRYKLASEENAIELSSFDPGLWAYDVSLTKLAVL